MKVSFSAHCRFDEGHLPCKERQWPIHHAQLEADDDLFGRPPLIDQDCLPGFRPGPPAISDGGRAFSSDVDSGGGLRFGGSAGLGVPPSLGSGGGAGGDVFGADSVKESEAPLGDGGMSSGGVSQRPRREWKPSEKFLLNEQQKFSAALVNADFPAEEEAQVDFCLEVSDASATFVPRSHRQAMSMDNAEAWRAAEISEVQSHIKNSTFGPPLSREQFAPGPPLRCFWIFVAKADGTLKARIAMLGSRMEAGLHFGKTFAPVPQLLTLRVFLCITAREGRDLHDFDVKTAFLTVPLDVQLDIILPPAFNTDPDFQRDAKPESFRRRCFMAIPGCRQGGRLFHLRIREVLLGNGFAVVSVEHQCLFRTLNDPPLWLLLWVDNVFVSALRQHTDAVARVLAVLRREFPNGVHVGKAETSMHFLGCVLERPRPNFIFLHQRPLLERLLRKAGIDKENAKDTPVAAGFIFTAADCPSTRGPLPAMDELTRQYRSLLMALNFAKECTRPDISFAVGKLAKFMHCPGERHVRALKRLFRFIKGSLQLGLVFDFSVPLAGPSKVSGFFDAAHADDFDTRRSTIAYVFFWDGVPLSWKSRLHSFVLTSSNHSELVASVAAAKEALSLRKLFFAIGLEAVVSPIAMFTDSMGCLHVSHGEGSRLSGDLFRLNMSLLVSWWRTR